MAQIPTDPMINIIASGRILTQPDRFYEQPNYQEIDLEFLAARMKNRLKLVIPWIHELRERYAAVTENAVTVLIEAAIDMMVDTAMALLYNRLRTVVEHFSPEIRIARMKFGAPISNRYEFPVFIASTLNSIGPLRIIDGPEDQLIIYVTAAERMQTYGRAANFALNHGVLMRFTDNLRAIGIRMAPIDASAMEQGSFFSTVIPTLDHMHWNFAGSVHSSHYENEDIVRAFLTLHDDVNFRPFKFCCMMIDECTTTAVTQAIAAAAPDNIPAGAQGGTGPMFPIGFLFETNIFGIRPGVPAVGTSPAIPSATYIIGRGSKPFYSCSLARSISEDELIAMLRHRILHSSV